MSDNKPTKGGDIINGLGILAGFFCFFLGFDKGGWVGGAVAAAIAFGGVHLAFAAVNLALRLVVGGAVLLLILAALKNRLDWLAELFQ